MATLGKITASGTSTSCNANYYWAVGPFTMPENGTATAINIYSTTSGSKTLIFGIYEDNGSDYPGTLVAGTSQETINSAAGEWLSFAIAASLTSGTKYWLAFNSSGGIGTYYEAGNLTKYKSAPIPSSMADPYPSAASSAARTYAIHIEYTVGSFDSVTITSPDQYQIYQRDVSDEADIPITGTYAGTPTAIEARFNGGAWVTIDSSLSGGAFSGILPSQAAGQGTLEVRFTNDTAVTGSVVDISIGDIYMVAGQSNHAGRLINTQSYSHASLKALMFKTAGSGTQDHWVELSDPTGDQSTGSIWPLLATLHMTGTGYPVGFICTAVGSTGLIGSPGGWEQTGSYYEAAEASITDSGVNGIRAILWHQGENESNSGTVTQSQYQTALMAMLDDFQTDTGMSMPMGVGQLLRYTSADSRESHDAIRAAQAYVWDNDTDMFAGPVLCNLSGDGTHIVTDAEGLLFAQRWWHFLKLKFFSGTEGRGPRQSIITKISTSIIRVIFDIANPPLQNATDTTGWRVVDDTGVLTILSCAAYGTTGVDITVSRDLDTNTVVSFGSLNDATGTTIKDSSTYELPPEPFYSVPIGEIIITTSLDGKVIIRTATATLLDCMASIKNAADNILDGYAVVSETGTEILDGKSIIKSTNTAILDGKSIFLSSGTTVIDGKIIVNAEGFSSSLLDGKTSIKSVATNYLDGLIYIGNAADKTIDGKAIIKSSLSLTMDGKTTIKDVASNLLDGSASISTSIANIVDGKIVISDAAIGLLDGNATILDDSSIVLDGKVFLSSGAEINVFDGKITLSVPIVGKVTVTFSMRSPYVTFSIN